MAAVKIPTERQYWREISLIVIIKVVVIAIIWWLCFSSPLKLTDKKVVDHYFTAQPLINQPVGKKYGH